MTTLDTLARSSAAAIHTSVADVRAPAMGIAGAAQAASMWRMAGYAIAGATAGAAVIFALLIAGPTQDDPADNVVPTTNVVTPVTAPDTTVTPTTEPQVRNDEPVPVGPVTGESSEETPVLSEDLEPPLLELTAPADGEHLDTRVVTFLGRTEPEAEVLASGKFSAAVDGDGAWFVDLVLSPGANGVVFTATDRVGNVSEIRTTVYLDVEEPKETTTTEAAWTFTANQTYGSCSEPIPYDVFSGKAKPGSMVLVSSPYGSGSTTANEDGVWSVEIQFPSAPYNKSFTVTAKDHAGSKETFSFVSLYTG
jgi:hypothetical protein